MGKNLTKNREVADARDFYMRPRVRELLVRAVREPIKSVIVTAGAGYGKTQTISTFLDPENGDINERKTHRFWMQIFEMDNLVERFWVSFTKVIAPVNAPLAKRLTLLGFPESERKYERFSALVSAETSSEIRRIFVFDDFHLIENKAILRFFERFMESPFLNTALIFISRQEPRVNPAGLAERGMVFRIEEEDLRFSKDEMHSYLEAIGITLPAQEDTDIYNATGGWPLAVRLIGLALKNNLNRRDRALSSMKSGVFKFIETEIFAPLTNEEKKLLVRLALIDHLPPALLHELTGSEEKSAWAVLDKVSSFVRYDAYSDAFRAHRLFKEFLQRRCELLTSEEKRRVYSRAAKWCHENDFKSDAVTYYEKAGDYSGLADVAHALTRMTPGRVARFLL
ncbi:MAG: hypothetical protein LBH17_01110, partial [Oscillospiraceae bacterium]|nr:hypothetical protein [Oscillospiraceae bacterium]